MAILARLLPRRLLVNSGSVFVGEALTRLATFFIAIIIARAFGPVALGQYGFAVAIASVLLLVPDLGLHMLMVRELATEPQRLRGVFWDIHWLKLLLLAGVVIFAALFGQSVIRDGGRRLLLYVLVVKIALQTFSQAYMAVFKAFEQMHFIAFQQFANAFLVLAWAATALAFHASVGMVVLALVAGQALETWLGWRIARRVFTPGAPRLWDTCDLRNMLVAGAPIGFATLLQALALRLDILTLSPYVSSRELGNFQAAAWFPVGACLFVSLLMAPVFPKLARLLRSPSARGNAYVESILKIGVLLTALGSIAVGLLAPALLRWFFGSELAPAVSTLRILAATLPCIFINTTMFYVLIAAQRRSAYLTALLLGVSVGSFLSLVFAARYGANGSAVADLLREFLLSMVYACFLKAGDIAQSTGRALLRVLACAAALTPLAILIADSTRLDSAWPAVWNLILVAGTLTFLGRPRLPEMLLLADDDL